MAAKPDMFDLLMELRAGQARIEEAIARNQQDRKDCEARSLSWRSDAAKKFVVLDDLSGQLASWAVWASTCKALAALAVGLVGAAAALHRIGWLH